MIAVTKLGTAKTGIAGLEAARGVVTRIGTAITTTAEQEELN